MGLIHIRLNLKYKGGKIIFYRFHNTDIRFSGKGSCRHLQKVLQEYLHAEIGEGRAEKYRSQISPAHFFQIELSAGSVKKLYFLLQLVQCLLSYIFQQTFLILHGDFQGFPFLGALFRIGINNHTAFIPVIYSFKSFS